MNELFSSLDISLKIFWICAIIASVVFVVQTVLVFVGAGTDIDVDGVDVDDAGFAGLFSFRNLINFLLGYGWSGVLLYDDIASPAWLYITTIAIGLLFVAAFVFMYRQIMKLSHDGSFKIGDTVGVIGSVYLRIPAQNGGVGKVQISVKGSTHEIEAITDDTEELATGTAIKVVEVIQNNILKVTKL